MTVKSHTASDFCVGSWIVRPSLSRIECDDIAVHLTPRAMSVLVYLGAARGAVVARNDLLDAVWPRMTVTGDALAQCIVELRRAFNDNPRHARIIETIPRVGVRLIAPVVALDAAAPAAPSQAAAPRTVWRLWATALGVATIGVTAAFVFALPSVVAPARPTARIVHPEAYELYLTAHYFRDRGEFGRAVLYAQQAVAVDANLALAHAELAAALTYQDTPFTDPERRARADAASQRAVELDPASAEVHALRAGIAWELGNFQEAERYVNRALELDASDAQARQSRAFLLMDAGRVDEALAEMLEARGGDPLSPHGHSMVGQWQYLAGRTDAAIASLERALELAPQHTGARHVLALAYFEQGREREAIELYLQLPISDALKETLRARLATDGSRGSTLTFDAFEAYCARNGLLAAELFAHYSAEEPMLSCLRDAVAKTPYPDLTLGFWMKASPVFATYRTDSRFAQVLEASRLRD